MVSKPNRVVSPAALATELRRLDAQLRDTVDQQDWPQLKRCDLEIRRLLQAQRALLRHPDVVRDLLTLKQTHQAAQSALASATELLRQKMNSASEQQERNLAYQLAMTMEY
ncbi:LafD [Vibrio sp.]|uniref:LafD n=1 Tax=Vibrio sp. TaxID=678 RepID=UPI003D0F6CF1